MLVNSEKTIYRKLRQDPNEETKHTFLQADNEIYSFKKIEKFEYLVVIISNKTNKTTKIENRLAKSRKANIRVYRTIIRPMLLYGSEA